MRAAVIRVIGALVLAAGGLVVIAPPAHAATATLTGAILCEKGGAVVGMWVNSSAGGSKWATLSSTSVQSVKKYSVSVPVPTSVRFDIGCGGSSSSWATNNRTAYRSISGNGILSAACLEAGGAAAQRCNWWGSTIFVAMPFTGAFNKFNVTHPSTHPRYDPMGDWATDIYAAPGTDVHPRIMAPSNGTPYQLRFIDTWTGCAGRGVRVGMYQNNVLRGTVSYAHLDKVPAFTVGQTLSTATMLGELRQWPRCATWDVDAASEVHTHVEVGTAGTPRACYSQTTAVNLPEAHRIGKIVPGSSPASPCTGI